MTKPVFVACERELDELDGYLQRSLAGSGQVCFVTGEAGSGKTALVAEFARRAQARIDNLIVAIGQSDAQTGMGDPYLPFREVLGLLTGDVDAKLAQGVISQENAHRLRGFLDFSGKALVELGPDLIGVFVPGAGLAARTAAFLAERVGWVDKLEQLLKQPQRIEEGTGTRIEQEHVFEQYTNVLRALAEKQPLLLIVDDLHWADGASIDLLFRLGRRIGGSRVLLIGTYRAEEVALGRGGQRHPLEKVLSELKRYFGDITVDLDEAHETEGMKFVDAFLDTEPNRLGAGFRQALFDLTRGHPLFTIELLRAMQERGNLVRDKASRWVEGPVLDWQSLPARVEGVIEERVGRLDRTQQDLLAVASVEGESFTAEVVACVQTMDLRDVVRCLGRELERQHQLVRGRGVRQVDGQNLSLYQFQHNLFRTYLYNLLSEAERTLLHEGVGQALENLHGDRADEIAVQLAWHFEQAGVPDKARWYLRRAGEQAAARFANAEALGYYTRALELTPQAEVSLRIELRLARERVYHRQGDRAAQKAELESLERLLEGLGAQGEKGARLRANLALRRAAYAEAIADYAACSADAQEVIQVARTLQDRALMAAAYQQAGAALRYQGLFEQAEAQIEQGLALAREAALPGIEADSRRALGAVAFFQGKYTEARFHYEQALRVYQQLGDRLGEGHSFNGLAVVAACVGAEDGGLHCYEEALRLYRKVGHRYGETLVLGNLGILAETREEWARAKAYNEQALEVSRSIGSRYGEGLALSNLGSVAEAVGDYTHALACREEALRLDREQRSLHSEAADLAGLGSLALRLGAYDQAQDYLEQCLRLNREIGERRQESVTLALLGLLRHELGQDGAAQECGLEALQIANELGNPHHRAEALHVLGLALAELGSLAQAREAFAAALAVWKEWGRRARSLSALAGLAQVSLAEGDLSQARAYVDEIRPSLEQAGRQGDAAAALSDFGESFFTYWVCYGVLRAAGDPSAEKILGAAYHRLEALASRIEASELRRSFLEEVAIHRELVDEYARVCDTTGSPGQERTKVP
jgi:adenylate cyclase